MYIYSNKSGTKVTVWYKPYVNLVYVKFTVTNGAFRERDDLVGATFFVS